MDERMRDEQTNLADDDEEASLTFTTPLPDRRLSRGDKITRGAVTGGIVLLALVVVLVMSGAHLALSLPESATPLPVSAPYTIQGYAPIQLARGDWQQIALPAPSANIFSYAVDPTHPGHIVLCTAGLAKPVAIWSTQDSGQHWTSLPFPQVIALYCSLSLAVDDPSIVLAQAGNPIDEITACSSALFFLSADQGQNWRQIPHTSIAPADSQGDCSAWATKHHLFIETDYNAGAGAPYKTLLERSDDGGQSWQRADVPAHQPAWVNIAQLGDGETLLADILPQGNSLTATSNPQLLISHNAGTVWSSFSAVLVGGPHLLVSPFASAANQSTPSVFYTVSGDEIPALLYRIQVAMSGPYLAGPLPPLPVPGASAIRTWLTDLLGVLPDGRLLAFGADPVKGLATDSAPFLTQKHQWLWLWDPAQQRWESFPTPLPSAWPDQCDALCWYAQLSSGVGPNNARGTYLYLMGWGAAEHPLYRVFLPEG